MFRMALNKKSFGMPINTQVSHSEVNVIQPATTERGESHSSEI